MSFKYGDPVFVKSGFHKGRNGRVFDRRWLRYGVSLLPDCQHWFWRWQIGRTFTVRPVDNAKTMENAREARAIIESWRATV